MSILSKTFTGLSYESRIKKFNKFINLMEPRPEDKILYIGGTIETENVYLESFFLENYKWLGNVTIMDIGENGLRRTKERFSEVKTCCCDVKKMPLKDKQFDISFCNAVIEHVGDYEAQKTMAEEIMRVSGRWFIATPNFWFPFELHYRLPFIHYFPYRIQEFSKKFIGGRYPRGKMPNINLLTAKKLQNLFPSSKIVKHRITIWPETLIVHSSRE